LWLNRIIHGFLALCRIKAYNLADIVNHFKRLATQQMREDKSRQSPEK